MTEQAVADREVLEIRLKLLLLYLLELQNGASSHKRTLFLPAEEPELPL
jgi:hypothetical protein